MYYSVTNFFYEQISDYTTWWHRNSKTNKICPRWRRLWKVNATLGRLLKTCWRRSVRTVKLRRLLLPGLLPWQPLTQGKQCQILITSWISATAYCTWKRFWDDHAALFEISVPRWRNLSHLCYRRVNYALDTMQRTTFIQVSKTFPATITIVCTWYTNVQTM